MPKIDDKILVQRTLSGDKNAFGKLVDRYKGAAFGLAFNQVKDFEDAKDIAQEAFIQACLKLETLREHSKFPSWLYTITVNLCRMWLRRKSKQPLSFDELDWIEEIPGQRKISPLLLPHWRPKTPEEEYEEKSLREAILAAVDSLPPKCRETVILYYMNGLSYQDIADFLAVSVSTVRGRLENGRRKLKKEMIAMIKEEFVRKVLEGVIRFPLRVQRLDENGHLVGVEKGYPGSQHEPKVLGCLFCAFKMIGHEIPYEQISAASGEAFRFAFEKNWCHEPEYITPVDALARACDILGFEYTSLRNQDLVVSLEAIERSIESGIPALIGMDRCWRLIVGYDKDRGEYYYIGGEWEIYQAKVGEKLSQFITVDECRKMKIPDADWYSCILGPNQIARNSVFVVGDRKAIPIGEAIRKTIQLAIDVSRPRRIERANLELRRTAMPQFRLRGRFLRSDPGHFYTGTDAIRKWAAKIDELKAPSHDFDIIHANDTTLRAQLSRMDDAVKYLVWTAGQFQGDARKHIEVAQEAFGEAAQVDLGMLCGGTGELYTEEDLRKEITRHPCLVHIVDEDKRFLLGDLADRSQKCPWGISVLPDQRSFDVAKRNAIANLNRIADLRDEAIAGLAKFIALE